MIGKALGDFVDVIVSKAFSDTVLKGVDHPSRKGAGRTGVARHGIELAV